MANPIIYRNNINAFNPKASFTNIINTVSGNAASELVRELYFGDLPEYGGILKRWNGSNWVECPSSKFRFFNNSIWNTCPSSNFRVYKEGYWQKIRFNG